MDNFAQDFFLTSIESSLGFKLKAHSASYILGSPELQSFLSDDKVIILLVKHDSNDDSFQLYIEFESSKKFSSFVLFLKREPRKLTEANLHQQVIVFHIHDSPNDTLYHILNKLYMPLFLEKIELNPNSDPKMTNLILELSAELASSLNKQKILPSLLSDVDAIIESEESNEYLLSVLTPADEFNYWTHFSQQAPSSELRERAAAFKETFSSISKEFDSFNSQTFSQILDGLDTVYSSLDELWKNHNETPLYSEKRMCRVIEVCSNSLLNILKQKLSETISPNVWNTEFSNLRDNLYLCIKICNKWLENTELFTGHIWRTDRLHPWQGPVFNCHEMDQFLYRLDELFEFRTLQRQAQNILSFEEAHSCELETIFDCFKGLKPFQPNKCFRQFWAAGVSKFYNHMKSADKLVALKIRDKFRTTNVIPTQVLREFKRFKSFLNQKDIKVELLSEREILLVYLTNYLSSLNKMFEQRSSLSYDSISNGSNDGKNLPSIVNTMIAYSQISSKVDFISKAESYLNDLSSFQSFHDSCKALKEEIKRARDEIFNLWCREIISKIEMPDSPFELNLNTSVLQLTAKDGRLVVLYPDNLVQLLREVRVLSSLGFTIPQNIFRTVSFAERCLRYGLLLKQISHFYNSIDQQIIPSQQPLMISHALSLESLISKPNIQGVSIGSNGQINVTWNSLSSLESYIDKLQNASEEFCSENRKLRKIHSLLVVFVEELFSIDLLTQQFKWKRNMSNIRDLIHKLEVEKSYDPSHLCAWRIHWDHQLYKAVGNCYSSSLQHLNDSLPEMKMDVVVRYGILQFKPTFEEVRAKYYREMKKFLLFPRNFKGIDTTDSPVISIFRQLITVNYRYFSKVFIDAEFLLSRLRRVLDHFENFIIIDSTSLDDLIRDFCHEYSDYERNFRLLKIKGREAEKLPNLIKIDRISVSTLPVKSFIDNQIQRMYDSLIDSLHRSVKSKVLIIENFISETNTNFSNTPCTMGDLSDAHSAQNTFAEKRKEIQPLLADIESRVKLAKMVSESSNISASIDWSQRQMVELRSKWDQLGAVLESHELLIRDQYQILRGETLSKVEQLKVSIENFSGQWESAKPTFAEFDLKGLDENQKLKILNLLDEKRNEFAELSENFQTIQNDCNFFSIPIPEFPQIDTFTKDLEIAERNINLFLQFDSEYQKLFRREWSSFRLKYNEFEVFINTWNEQILGMDDGYQALLLNKLLYELDNFRKVVPLLKLLRGENYSPDHWYELFILLEFSKSVTLENLIFGDFLNIIPTIVKQADFIRELNQRAQGEISIREALSELEIWGYSTTFCFSTYNTCDKVEIKIIKDWKSLVTEITENICLIQSLKDSPYFQKFRDKASIWEERLLTLDICIQKLIQIQSKWGYLEPIYGNGSFDREHDRFKKVDNDFREIITALFHEKIIITVVNNVGFLKRLESCLDQIFICQKALNDFLEEKRMFFPRFFFIGDEDLLEILGHAKEPAIILSHLQKLYAGINTVTFSESNEFIQTINSLDGEVVPLVNPVHVTVVVEDWLTELTNEMVATLKSDLSNCITTCQQLGYLNPHENNFSSQILCLSQIIMFTSRCQQAISLGKLPELLTELESQLLHLSESKIDVGDNTKLNILELKRKSLILDTIHFISIVKYLLNDRMCKTVGNWKWQKQLRYYYNSKLNDYMVTMVDASFTYTFEYQGNAPKVVQTPLTDKCFLTLTQGMLIGMGGNPYGPAGTGKTESVKALGGLFGRQVLVFNCDEAIDVKSMSRIFMGIVMCGAWGCFDEFNRLEEIVLSAISMQIQVIQEAIKEKREVVKILEQSVSISHHSGIFITLNPAGKGYGGRQKLPDNLKQLFLPVAMSQPDNLLIAEVLFYSEGFQYSEILSNKLVELFALSRELLSHQKHYDWGLRALKTVLQGSGSLLQKYRSQAKGTSETDLFQVEMNILIRAVRLNTLSKLTFVDTRRFNGLLNDIFPGIPFEDETFPEIEVHFNKYISEKNFVLVQNQLLKCTELYEQMNHRMGVLIVGPSGSGKSFLWRALNGTLAQMGQSIRLYCLNPKAIHRNILLGSMDQDTREWSDGILTVCSRKVCQEPSDVISWIVLDGDIDPEWIESLNSVLDDNRLLTIPSGERIQFGPNVHFLFETHDISFASPATISRMGIIFLNNEEIDIKAVVVSYIKTNLSELPKSQLSFIIEMVKTYFYRCFEIVLAYNELALDCSKMGIVLNGLSQIESVHCPEEFALAMIRGFGSILTLKLRRQFATEVLEMMGIRFPNQNDPCNMFYDGEANSLRSYDVMNNLHERMDIKHCFSQRRNPLINTIDVQKTIDTIRNLLFSKKNPHFILAGPDGCGKETILSDLINKIPTTRLVYIYCNSETKPRDVITKLFELCLSFNTNEGKMLRPKGCDKLVILIKGLNLPKPDKWGTVQLVAFLQQVATYDGFYHSTLEWISLNSVQIIATLNPTLTMGRYNVSTRLTSILRICYLHSPEQDDLKIVIETFLRCIFRSVPSEFPSFDFLSNWGTTAHIHSLADSMVTVYNEVSRNFTFGQLPYIRFTPKLLSEWAQQFSLYISSSEGIASEEELLRVFRYEAERIFRDKFKNLDAKSKFDHLLIKILAKFWNSPDSHAELQYSSILLKNKKIVSNAKFLFPINKSDFDLSINKIIQSYTSEVESLPQIFLSNEVVSNFARVDRVLTKPGGSIILLGRSGAGRHLALKLAAFHHKIEVFTPHIGRGYGIKRFKQDLKTILQTCGVENREMIFLLENYQLFHPSFLDMINSLLSSGEVPGLFRREEMAQILTSISEDASENGYGDNLEKYFYSRTKLNLHITLILDISSPQINSIFDNHPALNSICTTIIMDSWSLNTIQTIPRLLIESLIPHLLKFFDIGDLTKHIVKIFSDSNGSIPLNLLSLVRLFVNIYRDKFDQSDKLKQKLDLGIQKITEATNKVSDLRNHADVQRSLLSEKQAEADSALEMITKSMHQASEQKFEMEKLAQRKKDEKFQLEERKTTIDTELSVVMPLLEQSRSAVSAIKPESIAEIRVLRAPPDVIRDILEAVLLLMGIYDTSWHSIKTFLGKRGVRDEICQFDARNIAAENRNNVEEFVEARKKSFTPEVAKRASVAAAPLANWIISILRYSHVLHSIKPLEAEKNQLSNNLVASDLRMKQIAAATIEIDQDISKMKVKFESFTSEAAKLKLDIVASEEIIGAAENLVNKLIDEQTRWSTQLESLEKDRETIATRCLLSSAYILYLGGSEENERFSKLSKWKSFLDLQGEFSINNFLVNETLQLNWKHEGLPCDELSISNVVILKNTLLCPLIIDPSNRVFEWLKTHLSKERLEIVNISDDNFVTKLELCIRFGKNLIIQDVVDIEPILYNLIRRETCIKGSGLFIHIGDKQIDFNEDFRLFLISRNKNQNYPPEILSHLALINFSFTQDGLSSQLLALTMQVERPELEDRKRELLYREESLRLDLSSLEESLLQTLATSEGSLLENKSLLASLNDTKEKSANITVALKESKQLQISIDKERNLFLPFAQTASRMYFILTTLYQMNHMYRYSLDSFIILFKRALESSNSHQDADSRNYTYISRLQTIVFNFVIHSLFENQILTFSIYFVHRLYPNLFDSGEWEYFCGLNYVESDSIQNQSSPGGIDGKVPTWCDSDRASDIVNFMSRFPKLYSLIELENEEIWLRFMRTTCCEDAIPQHILKRLTPFQILLIIQTLRPDRLHTAMEKFCAQSLGFKELNPFPLQFKDIYSETNCSYPVLFIVSPGADPSHELQDLAREVIGSDHYFEMPMGQGQSKFAMKRLRECAKSGDWLCFKNMHLVIDLLPDLEKLIFSLQPHNNFRLFLISEQHDLFSINLLNLCLKISYEILPGVKNNLFRSYDQWTPGYIAQQNNPIRAQVIFILTWFHVLIQERCNFVPLGWSKRYGFSLSELRAAGNLIDRLSNPKLGSGNEILWLDHLHGLLENCFYGGRIDNGMDFRILKSFISPIFSPKVILDRGSLGPFKTIPHSVNNKDFIQLINDISHQDNPSILSLPRNVDVLTQRLKCKQVLSQIKLMVISELHTTDFNLEKISVELSPIFNLWKKMNKGTGLITRKMIDTANLKELAPLMDFIIFELNNAFELIKFMHSSLFSIKCVLDGKSDLTNYVKNQIVSLIKFAVPSEWTEKWDGPENISEYLHLVVKKTLALENWFKMMQEGTFFSSLIDLSHVFYPGNFFSAFRQHISRVKNTCITELKFTCSWEDNTLSNALMINGLNIQGCLFDGKQISPTKADSLSYYAVPQCCISCIQSNQIDVYQDDFSVPIPLYTSQKRDHIIAMIKMPCGSNKNIWIESGVALFIFP